MRYLVKPAALQGQEILFDDPLFLGPPKLFVDGKPVPRSEEKGQPFTIPARDGTTKRLFVRYGGIDRAPVLMLDGQRIDLVRPLTWYELLFGTVPLLLIFVNFIVGAIVGALTSYWNYGILRSERPVAAKIVLVVGWTIVALALTLGLGYALQQIKIL